jgi:hypothetical protein
MKAENAGWGRLRVGVFWMVGNKSVRLRLKLVARLAAKRPEGDRDFRIGEP